jgi:hypothetical protein
MALVTRVQELPLTFELLPVLVLGAVVALGVGVGVAALDAVELADGATELVGVGVAVEVAETQPPGAAGLLVARTARNSSFAALVMRLSVCLSSDPGI